MVAGVGALLRTSRGLEMAFEPADHQLAFRVENEGRWEEDIAKAIEKFLEPGWTFLDVGAHVGYFTLIAASRGNDVIAIEPDPDRAALLLDNVERNGLTERVSAYQYAVSDEAGPAYLAVDSAMDGAPGTAHLAPAGREVEARLLGELLGERRPEFIKIDIEGMEAKALAAAPEVLDAAQVIVFEAGPNSRRYGQEPTAIVDLLSEHGFTVTYMNGLTLNDDWADLIDGVPNGYINLIARRNPKAAVKGTVLLCAWRDLKIETAESLLLLRDYGWGYAIARGDALISRSRSRAVSNWYRYTNDDVFLMIDDDIVFDVGHAERVLELAREKRGIAVAAYAVKDGGHLACRRFPGQEVLFGEASQPVEIEYPATGFMACHRDVIAAMVEAKLPSGEPVFPYCDEYGLSPMWPLFDTFCVKWNEGTPEERWEYLSEDYAFGHRARELGFKVWLDPSVTLYHLGTYPYNVHEMRGSVDPETRQPKSERFNR